MFSNKKLYILLFSLGSSFVSSQEIDTSMLSMLSPDQMMEVQDAIAARRDASAIEDSLELTEITESLEFAEIEDANKLDGKKFGYSFFATIPTNTSALGDLPLPNDYKISIRDQFTVILSGSKELIFDLNVKLDGTILFPEIGSISVAGETFGQVKKKLTNLINQSYVGVQIDLSIKNLSAKKITIVGAVKTPGTYLVNPFSTISSSLAYSGGISEIGTLRKIKLYRNNGKTFVFDLYKMLINGDRSDDITIEAGDTILVEAASQFTELSGEVIRPGIYEVLESESVYDLIKFGLGFNDVSNKAKISLSSLDIQNNKIYQKETDDLTTSIRNVKNVSVYPYLSEIDDNILVSGAVAEPGYYNLEEFKTLSDLINGLEFIDVYPWLAAIEQFDKENLSRKFKLFSLKDQSTYESIKLLPNSKVYFANTDERSYEAISDVTRKNIEDYSLRIFFKDDLYLLPVIGKFLLNDFINFLGFDMSDVDPNVTYVSPLDNKIITSSYQEIELTASKYNTASFKSMTNDLIEITISGYIDYPGVYTLKSDATLSDLYDLVGTFKDSADLDSIIFKREAIRERQLSAIRNAQEVLRESLIINSQNAPSAIDGEILKALAIDIDPEDLGRIAGNYNPNNLNINNIVLFNGDDIYVPAKSTSISVIGEVLNPNSFLYQEGTSSREAIEFAGGFKEFADQRKVYIIRADGLVVKPNKNIFAGKDNNYLFPGDTLIVPRKLIVKNPISQSIAPITQVLSDLAFSAAAIESLSNN